MSYAPQPSATTPFDDENALALPPPDAQIPCGPGTTPFMEPVEPHEPSLSELPDSEPPLANEEELPWTGSAEQTAFQETVLAAHLARSRKRRKRSPGRDLTADELAPVAGTGISLRRDAAAQASRLIAAANAALAQAKGAGDPDARLTTHITASSGYRGSEYQAKVWRRNFPGYYRRTAQQREALPGGPHGDAAVHHLLEVFKLPNWVAAPGYSNHQAGIAIDLVQRRKGTPIRNSSRPQALAAWRRTWFHRWLTENAAAFGFRPYEKEPWHWEFRPEGGSRSEREAQEYGYGEPAGLKAPDDPAWGGEESDAYAAAEAEEDQPEDTEFYTAEESEEYESEEDSAASKSARSYGAYESEDSYTPYDAEAARNADTDDAELRATHQLMRLEMEHEDPGLLDRAWGVLSFGFGQQPIQLGSTGSAVWVLQNALRRLGHTVTVDGTFGTETRTAVRAFQRRHGLCDSGMVAHQTRNAIVRESVRLSDPAADPLPQAIVRVARSQLPRWRVGGQWLRETDPAATPILQEYYRDGRCQEVTSAHLQSPAWHGTNFWSAVFVSWVMRTAGAGNAFAYSRAHRTYVRAARHNRCQNTTANPFWAYRVTEVAPEPGDLVCRNDHITPPATYENIDQPIDWHLHCDIVTVPAQGGRIMVTGGNVAVPGGNPHHGVTVAERPLRVRPDGLLDLGHHPDYIAVVRCRGAAAHVPQPC